MECQKQKNLNFMSFDICYTYGMGITMLNFNYTLLRVNYMLSNKYCTLLNVNYMLSKDHCTLLKIDYMFEVNCKLSCEHFMLLNSHYTFLVQQNYIWSTDLKIETFWNYILLKKATCHEKPALISEEPVMS